MMAVSTTSGILLVYTTIMTLIEHGEAASRTGRRYGTWVDRRRERSCQRTLVCEYRLADCTNTSPQNQWRCTAIINSMQSNMCTLQVCDRAQGMMCSETDPGGNMTEVESNTCATGQKCYAPATITTTVALSTTAPTVTFVQTTGVSGGTTGVSGGTTGVSRGTTGVSGGITGVSGGTTGVSGRIADVSEGTTGVSGGIADVLEGTTGAVPSEVTTGPQLLTVSAAITTQADNATVSTTSGPDEIATDVIWSSALQDNPTPLP